MKITAELNHFRMSPRKVRLVADAIRGMDVREAEIRLKFLTKRAAGPLLKLLKSAIANAHHNFNIEKDNLFISGIQVNQGKTLKRWRARAMGRAYPIMRRVSHINLVLEAKKEVKAKKKIKTKPEVVKTGDVEGKKATPVEIVEEKKEITPKPKPVLPARPYGASPGAKRRFFSRQTFSNVKKIFRRKAF